MSRIRTAARLATLRPTAVNRVMQEARAAVQAGKEIVSLMRGQPDTPTARPIVEAAQQALARGRTGYPDNQGELELCRAVSEKLRRDQGLTYDPTTEILITDGATAGIAVALGALIDPGDEVLLPDPVYDAYHSVIALWGGRPVSVPATIHQGRFSLDARAFVAACTSRTRVILLNSPWNPVGSVLRRDELQGIADFAAERDLFILSDEIYEALVYDGRCSLSVASLSAATRARTVLVNSLSKSYAMTGWRVGYCAGSAELIAAMLLILQQSSRGPATFVQDAAACALRGDQASVHAMTAEYQARRDRTVARLSGIPGVVPMVPEGGLFVMLDVRGLGQPSDAIRRRLLEEAGVLLIHGAAYGPGGEGTLRVSFAAGGVTLERGLERLRVGLKSIGNSHGHR